MTEAKIKQKTGTKRSKLVIALYVLAGLMAVLGAFMVYYSIGYVKSYYSGYGMSVSDGLMDIIQYVISSSISYFVYGVVFFGLAVILKKVNLMQLAVTGQESTVEQEETVKLLEEEAAQEETENKQKEESTILEPEGVL